jgi:DNA polymerase-3 subunit gamma/tau
MSIDIHKPIPLKYRPRKFSDLIGQESIVQTIKNAIKLKRIANAYLLTGVRGVGKTTSARIIAMSLNCQVIETEKDTFQEPCGECENCISISESRSVDVLEMDAASRTGISDIRELIEGVQYAPISSKYKIYIIDEVHMLSTAAFNGLLKTLEEPPPHVKFIFATTEVRKIPTTILSRCQRYDLKRVEPIALSEYLNKICSCENISIDEGALKILSRAADGSVRDGLSLLDQSIAYSDGNVNEELVKEMIGLNDPTQILDLLKLIVEGKTEDSLKRINELYDHGADPVLLLKDLITNIHQIGMIKIGATEGIQNLLTVSEFQNLKELSINLEIQSVSMIWQMFNKGLIEVQNSFSPISSLEMLIIRLIYLKESPNPEELISELSNSISKVESENSGDSDINSKVKEIMDFFPGAEVENID